MKSNLALNKAFSNLFQRNIGENNLLVVVKERLEEMLLEDSIDLIIYLFFFPSENTKEQNVNGKF